MAQKPYPKKGIGSYLLPFLLILALLGSGVYIIQNNLNISDLMRVFSPPEVAKDEKVSIAFQDGSIEYKPWRSEDWGKLSSSDFLQAGDSLKVPKNGALVLRFFEGSEIRLQENSHIKLMRLDKDDEAGNHLALELISGQVWARIQEGNNSDADFIINTTHQIVQSNQASVIDVKTNPEITRVLGGEIMVNVAQKLQGARKPIGRLTLSSGEQLTLDELTIDQIKAGEKEVTLPVSKRYLESEWYSWNKETEEQLGMLVEFSTLAPEPVEREPLEDGLVLVTSPKPDAPVGNQVLVEGTYDNELIESIFVNDQAATLGLENEWERSVQLSEDRSTLTVTARKKGEEQDREVASFSLRVDTKGPGIGKILQPEVDENGNGVLTEDSLELKGEVGADAISVCVSHNDKPGYCLKEFSSGDTSFRYLGAVRFGNVVSGRNKYAITATDKLGNKSTKVIYLFKDEEKPAERIEESSPATENSSESATSLPKPVITNPDPEARVEVDSSPLVISGTTSPQTQSLLVNDKKASYSSGSESFEISLELSEGENTFRVQAVDSTGEKSKSAIISVLYLPEDNSTEE